MTTTREQLEGVINRQLAAMTQAGFIPPPDRLDASRRAILAAIDDWAAATPADAVTMRAAADVLRRRSGPGRPNLVTDILIRILDKLAGSYGTTSGAA